MKLVDCPSGVGRRHRKTFQRPGVAVVLALGILALSPIASNATPSQLTTSSPSVGVATCTFVDHSRSLKDYATTPPSLISSSRILVTEIRYPTTIATPGASEQRNAPPLVVPTGYPVIVFAHGYDVTPDIFAPLFDAWVRAGFVVVAPLFPDEKASEVSAQHGANTEGDLANEPGDLAFVTQSVLQSSSGRSPNCPVVRGLINPTQLALAGHSDGATAVAMLAFDHGLDPQGVNYATLRTGLHFDAIAIFSGAKDSLQSYAAEASRPNVLIIHSRDDQCNPLQNDVTLYDSIHQSNKWFLELQHAHHLPPFDGTDPTAFHVVVATTIRFFRESLPTVTSTTDLLADPSVSGSVARLYRGALGPNFERAPKLKAVCGLT